MEKEQIVLKVKEIAHDDWSRPRVKVIEGKFEGVIFADTTCGGSSPDWHTTTTDYGEPISRLASHVKLEIVKEKGAVS